MSDEGTVRTCGQSGCSERAFYRYTWPGKDEGFICQDHSIKLHYVASAIGLHLQLIELQWVKERDQSMAEAVFGVKP